MALITIEDINYIFWFIIGDAPPTAGRDNPNPKSLRFTIAGSLDVPCQWWFPDVGTINGRQISVAFTASAFRQNLAQPVGIELKYTFTASVAGALGLLP